MDVFEVCKLVARSLVAEIGPWGNHCAFIGGLVPGLLLPDPGGDLAPHVLEEHFATTEHTGPIGWVDSSEFTGEERARELREAVGIVRDFVSRVRANQTGEEKQE